MRYIATRKGYMFNRLVRAGEIVDVPEPFKNDEKPSWLEQYTAPEAPCFDDFVEQPKVGMDAAESRRAEDSQQIITLG